MSRVFYLGPQGTFSHILARRRFGSHAELGPCSSIAAVFDQVAATPGAVGLVPVENSSGGTVYDSVDSLIRHAGRLFVGEELALDVRIALLGHAGEDVRTVYSHFTQVKHYAEWLSRLHPKARLREVESTAVAASRAAGSRQAAALASPGAADIYGLDVLAKPPSTDRVNVTHFFTIQSTPAAAHPAGPLKTSLIATLPNVCGSLHRFLGPFARQNVSLTGIVSRPVPGKPQTYVFYIEIEGGPDQSKSVSSALQRAGTFSERLVSLGTYPVGRRFKS